MRALEAVFTTLYTKIQKQIGVHEYDDKTSLQNRNTVK